MNKEEAKRELLQIYWEEKMSRYHIISILNQLDTPDDVLDKAIPELEIVSRHLAAMEHYHNCGIITEAIALLRSLKTKKEEAGSDFDDWQRKKMAELDKRIAKLEEDKNG